jgi:hypothetical protein
MDYGPGDVSFQSLGTRAGFVDQEGPSTGLFYTDDGLNMIIIAGQFTANLSDGTTAPNLLLLNNTSNGTQYATSFKIQTEPQSGTERAKVTVLETVNTTLFVGGTFSSIINGSQLYGLVLCDLKANELVTPQPPALQGSDLVVTSITTRPLHQDVYVGGSFLGAGELTCEGVCVWSMMEHKWSTPGTNLRGAVQFMVFTDQNTLVASGNLSIDGAAISLATYYVPSRQWTAFNLKEPIPGSITAMIQAQSSGSTSTWSSDSTAFWIAGQSTDGSAFLMKWNGTTWLSLEKVFGPTTQITGLELISTQKPHDATKYLDKYQALLLLGVIELPSYGNVSAALYDGTTFQPFIITFDSTTGEVGRLTSIFTTGQFFGGAVAVDDKGNVVAIGVSVIGALLAIIFIGEIQGRLANRIAARNDRRKYPPIVDLREKSRIHKILLATQRRDADNKG